MFNAFTVTLLPSNCLLGLYNIENDVIFWELGGGIALSLISVMSAVCQSSGQENQACLMLHFHDQISLH